MARFDKVVARRVGTLAAYAGGAVTAAGAVGVGVLFGQALLARLTIPGAEAPPPRCAGVYGAGYSGEPLRLAVLGDSTAAGYGVHTASETPGALLATWIADALQRPVRLCCPAFVGAISAWLAPQVETAIEEGVDLAIIFIGANDVTTRADEAAAVRHLGEAVRTLRAAGAEVVVATCPDLGTIQPIQPPLRWVARAWSRRLAAAQTVATVAAGGRTVSLGDLLGPQFAAAPDRMFGADRYHPSAEGYRAAAEVVLPSALAALGIETGEERRSALLPLPDAAGRAAQHPGTEVTGDERAAGASAGEDLLGRVRRWVHSVIPARSGAGAVPDRSVAAPGPQLAVPSVLSGGPTPAVAPTD